MRPAGDGWNGYRYYDTVRLVCKSSHAPLDPMLEAANLWQLIDERAAATPNVLMAVDERDRRLSFAEYREAALRAARGLAKRGIGPGQTVSWMLPSNLASMILVGALARLGAVQNPILPIFRAREVRFIVEQCKPTLLVTPPNWRGFDYPAMAREIAASHAGLKTLVVDRALPEAEDVRLPPRPAWRPPSEQPPRWIFYSSGTTADPKGALHTDASLWAATLGMGSRLELRASDRVAFVFPISHIGGINWLMAGLSSGCCLIVIENFADPETIPTLQRNGVTLATAGTVFHEAYLKAQRECPSPPLFPNVRAFPGGGAPKAAHLHYDLRAEMGGVGIVSGYGMTEAPILTMGHVDDPTQKLAETEGRKALAQVELCVIGAGEKPVGFGVEGELRVRGPQLFLGYVDARLDQGAFDANGYFRTGDLGHLDEAGYLVVTGRLKDVIIRKGENIPAREIEAMLGVHPNVEDVAVIGLPDSESGERVCAVVRCRDASHPLEFTEMQAFLRAKDLMVQKIPEQLEIVDAIPRNATGKILKEALRKRYSEPGSASTSAAKRG